ncbi:integrase [Luteimonas padinae]|jgi:integrase/recombinase XerD|uniref:Tyrosine-type recombinase/integrase n=1 Tax=Luteimonas padinae TaxID=1714359 RepID=A0ABV6SYG2_9GAMM|nr:tyrosine-type recombinase/integrase [Luteimonas padinae]GHD67777.1 integrase [Luteimonas padinae]
MELIWSTDDFKLHGVSYRDFPILLDSEMVGVSPANTFLRYHLLQRGRVGSAKSWKVYGQALYDYFGFLEAHDLVWNDTPKAEDHTPVAAYRDYCKDTIGLSLNTVRQRLYLICEFYKYAHKQNWIETLPFSREIVLAPKADTLLEHIDSSGDEVASTSVMPKMRKTLPQFLSTDQIQQLLATAHNPHHKMIVRMGLQTGLRREEIATFPYAYLIAPARLGHAPKNIRVHLDPEDGHGMRTKGNKERTIYISRNFMKDLWHYFVQVRGERARQGASQSNALFLNQDGNPFAAGGKGIERIVRNLGASVGIKVWPHMLRHTYATHTLNSMQQGDKTIEPIVFLQRQLGHESIQTTMVYAHLIDELADAAVLQYDDEVTEWSRA